MLCGAVTTDLRRLARFGRLFGLGYQMLDDLHDGESRRNALVEIRRVLEAAQQSASATGWEAVAGAFIRPALADVDELSQGTGGYEWQNKRNTQAMMRSQSRMNLGPS
jgi:hypothetical protein